MTKLLRATALAGFLFFAGNGSLLAEGNTGRAALQYFEEADALVRADGGRLWGVSLGGGLLLVDPETRIAYANQPDSQGRLVSPRPGFAGRNRSGREPGEHRARMVGRALGNDPLPLPEEREVRATLILHELWHGVQDRLGLPASSAPNNQLDTRDGRYWLQLEWRALAAALAQEGAKRAEANTDAALFRAQRRAIFPGVAEQENAMEMHEGLAEYTGVKLSGATDPVRFVIENELQEAPRKESFVRSFAYANGPAYGLLLDAAGAPWREQLSPQTDLGSTLLRLAQLKLPEDLRPAADRRALVYGGPGLAAVEEKREKEKQRRMAGYRARLVEGSVLKIPLRQIKVQFDPGNLVPLDSLGTVYPSIRIVDAWGILAVASGGALLSPDFSQVVLPQPKDITPPKIRGDGWTLELKPGWSIGPGQRKGDLTLQSSSSPPPQP